MAVRTPVYRDGSNHIREMSSGEISAWQTWVRDWWIYDKSVTLSIVASGGNLGVNFVDTRMQAGVHSQVGPGPYDTYPPETTTAEPTQVTVNYDRISATTASLSAPNFTYEPLYINASNHLQAMSSTDIYDTFIDPGIDLIPAADPYYMSFSSTPPAGYTILPDESGWVASDTRANTAAYTAAGIPETLDQPIYIATYYLHEKTPSAPSAAGLQHPEYISSNNVKTVANTTFADTLKAAVRYRATQIGSKVTFSVGTSATNPQGSGAPDTRLTGGSGNYQTRLASDVYYAQEFPNGTATTINTYYLDCNIT